MSQFTSCRGFHRPSTRQSAKRWTILVSKQTCGGPCARLSAGTSRSISFGSLWRNRFSFPSWSAGQVFRLDDDDRQELLFWLFWFSSALALRTKALRVNRRKVVGREGPSPLSEARAVPPRGRSLIAMGHEPAFYLTAHRPNQLSVDLAELNADGTTIEERTI
jgi:hypothetical protein